LNKIEYVEQAFCSAHDFANTETGTGLYETDFGQFRDAIKNAILGTLSFWLYFKIEPQHEQKSSAKIILIVCQRIV